VVPFIAFTGLTPLIIHAPTLLFRSVTVLLSAAPSLSPPLALALAAATVLASEWSSAVIDEPQPSPW
jgi:hypothetical protein